MHRKLLTVVVGLLLGQSICWGEPAQKNLDQVPSPSAVRAAKFTPVHRAQLPNGMRLLLAEAPEENIVAVEVIIQTGILEEKTNLSGLTRMLSLLIERKIARDAKGLPRLENVGASVRTTQELDYCRISLMGKAAHSELLLEALADGLTKPITQDELNAARKKFNESLTDPQGALSQLYEIFRQAFYRYHPYRGSQRGSEMAMERIDVKTAQAFLNQNFAPNKIIMAISGRFEPIATQKTVEKRFSSMQAVQPHELDVAWEPQSAEKEVYLSGGSEVGWLFVGYPAPPVSSPDYASMKLLSAILGEGLSSRLFTEIREKRSLCYEINSLYPVLRGPSHFLTYTVTKPEHVYAAKKQFVVEIEKIRKEPISQKELDESRRKVIGNFLLERETNSGRAFQLALAEGAGVGYEFEQAFLKNLDNVTPQSLQKVAQKYLENSTLIIARPPGRFYWDL